MANGPHGLGGPTSSAARPPAPELGGVPARPPDPAQPWRPSSALAPRRLPRPPGPRMTIPPSPNSELLGSAHDTVLFYGHPPASAFSSQLLPESGSEPNMDVGGGEGSEGRCWACMALGSGGPPRRTSDSVIAPGSSRPSLLLVPGFQLRSGRPQLHHSAVQAISACPRFRLLLLVLATVPTPCCSADQHRLLPPSPVSDDHPRPQVQTEAPNPRFLPSVSGSPPPWTIVLIPESRRKLPASSWPTPALAVPMPDPTADASLGSNTEIPTLLPDGRPQLRPPVSASSRRLRAFSQLPG